MVYKGKATYDSRPIGYYQSSSGNCFHIIISRIFRFSINLKLFKETDKQQILCYRANITDTFQVVKEYIQDTTGVPYEEITLAFEDNILNDSIAILDVGSYPWATVDVIFNDNLFNN